MSLNNTTCEHGKFIFVEHFNYNVIQFIPLYIHTTCFLTCNTSTTILVGLNTFYSCIECIEKDCVLLVETSIFVMQHGPFKVRHHSLQKGGKQVNSIYCYSAIWCIFIIHIPNPQNAQGRATLDCSYHLCDKIHNAPATQTHVYYVFIIQSLNCDYSIKWMTR